MRGWAEIFRKTVRWVQAKERNEAIQEGQGLKPFLCLLLLGACAISSAQAKLLYNLSARQDDTAISFQAAKFSVGHGQWKSYWSIEPLGGIVASDQAASKRATLFALPVFYRLPFRHLNWTVGWGPQSEGFGKVRGAFYFGLNL